MTSQDLNFEAITDEALLAANGGVGFNERFLPDHPPVHVQSLHGTDRYSKLQNLTVNFG